MTNLWDFRRAATDAGVAQQVIPVGYREVQGLAGSAEHLHDLVNAAASPLASAILDHGRLNAHVVASIGAGGGLAGGCPQRHDVNVHVGQHPLNGLPVGDGTPVGDPLLGPLDSHFQGAA